MFDLRAGLLGLCLLPLWALPVKAEETLGIFYPSVKQPKDVQKAFADDAALKNVKVLAFGSFEDFQTAVTSENITFALVPSAYIRYFDDFEGLYQLTLDGKSTFQDVVVTLDPAWNEARLDQGIVGAINVIGREKTRKMVEDLLAGKSFKRLKQVSKIADLYPLLALGNAQYAIFSPHDLDMVKAEFASKPIQVFRTGDVLHPLITVRKTKKSKNGDFFLKLSPSTLKTLGVNGIKSFSK
ncbi:MAG: hypothetical protein M3Q07_13280 [Pseudobdellovibrionaceae bacterium]|uniref:hypothetical protein n=1 Tax=Oligoflexus sp. TaxID=1971216 RepID=UPI0027C70FED|nr:hypothetical protein [Oligoflexus sp.]MDQ3232783.1 hypothetical protein [Pseudobdellovibrionaceae bacterium]HYX33516.1 hypothetical protein [Oligoflexus sp.]